MASFKLVALIFAVFIGSFVVQAREFGFTHCKPNEHFDRCGKPISCQRSCQNPEGRVCTALCTPTCVCHEDRVRNHLNECVHRHECRLSRRFF